MSANDDPVERARDYLTSTPFVPQSLPRADAVALVLEVDRVRAEMKRLTEENAKLKKQLARARMGRPRVLYGGPPADDDKEIV